MKFAVKLNNNILTNIVYFSNEKYNHFIEKYPEYQIIDTVINLTNVHNILGKTLEELNISYEKVNEEKKKAD